MVLVHFKSLHPFLKVARRCFVFLDERCTLHRRCCTLRISIFRTDITFGMFRYTGVITVKTKLSVSSTALTAFSRKWIISYPKKAIRTSIGALKFFSLLFLRQVNFYVKKGTPWLVFDLPSLESGAPWYRYISNTCTQF